MRDPIVVRAAIRAGTLRGRGLRDAIEEVAAIDRDAWFDRVLGIEGLADDGPDLPSEGVPYLPCAVAELLAIVDACEITRASRVVDLGSGVGRALALLHLVTGASVHGVEVQADLVDRARELAAAVHLPTTFEHADARVADLDGDVFVLYAPFTGGVLREVLDRLVQLARVRSFRVATIDLALPAPFTLVARPTRSTSLYMLGPETSSETGPEAA